MHHTTFLAVYRKHDSNATNNFRAIVDTALLVLARQRNLIRSPEERQCLERGRLFWKNFYSEKIYNQLRFDFYQPDKTINKKDLNALKRYNRPLYKKFIEEKKVVTRTRIRNKVKSYLQKLLPFKLNGS